MVRTYAVHAGPYVPDVDDVHHVPDVPIWHDVPAVPVVSAVHVVHAVPQPPQRKIRMMLTWARLIFFVANMYMTSVIKNPSRPQYVRFPVKTCALLRM